MNAFDGRVGGHLQRALMAGAWILVALLAACLIYVVSSIKYIGAGLAAANTLQASGESTAYATPDIGQFSFSVVSDKDTVKAAQDDAAAKANTITAYLKGAGVEGKDIKTTDYNVSPRYDYQQAVCPQAAPVKAGAGGASAAYCPGGKQVLIGYEVTQTTEIKVRDSAKAGDLLSGVGDKGATNVSGLQFTTEDPTAVQTEARDQAIADAKAKAEKLAGELGVSLVRVTAFQENQGGVPVPVAYESAAAGKGGAPSVAPDISTGQNKVTDTVTITYEIR